MGIKGLWEILAPASENKLFSAYAYRYFEEHGRPCRLGIDTSGWFYEFANALRVGHASSGENPELRSLFFRVTQLFRLPLTPLFVFDGPARPTQKRNKSVKTTEIWIVPAFRKFVEALGFDYHNAPGEAEAELALLNRMGLIDVILTEDSDVFVFGALSVLRGGSKLTGNIALYQAAEIQRHPQIGLGPGGFLLMAILCGGDYDTVGLRGCAHTIALKLAQCGFGDGLYKAMQESEGQALQDFLHKWREQIKTELLTDSRKILGRQYASLSNSISTSFPSVETLNFYVKPSVTQTPFPPGHIIQHLGHRYLDPAQLAWLCCRHFGWSDTSERSIAGIFEERIWPGVALRAMTFDMTSHLPFPAIYDGLDLVCNEDAETPCADSIPMSSVVIKVSQLHRKMTIGITKFNSGLVTTSGSNSSSATSDTVASNADTVIDVNVPLSIVKSYKNRTRLDLSQTGAGPSETTAPAAFSNPPTPILVAGSSADCPIVLSDSPPSITLDHDEDVISISSGSVVESDGVVELVE